MEIHPLLRTHFLIYFIIYFILLLLIIKFSMWVCYERGVSESCVLCMGVTMNIFLEWSWIASFILTRPNMNFYNYV